MSRRLLVVFVLAAAVWNACREPSEKRVGRPMTAALAGGAFFPSAVWIDVAERYDQATRQFKNPWQVPATPYLVVEDGWGGPEDWGVAWGLGDSTHLRFFLPRVRPYDFFLRAMAPDDPQGRTQSVTVRLNGRELSSWEVPRDWFAQRFAVPVEALRQGMNDLELVYGFHLEGVEGSDDRPLALAFERLGFLPADERPEWQRHGAGFVLQKEKETLLLAASGSYVVPIEVGAGDVAFEVETKALRRFLGNPEMTLRAGVLDLEGRKEVAFEIDGDSDDAVRRIPLTSYRGGKAFLFFTAELAYGNRFLLRRPRLVSEEAPEEKASAKEIHPPAERPNIVVIVLDAARVDHFGLYGYSRDTTPEIDRLGRESLVFTQVVAECCYTVCSTPSLLTGLSYVQHGLVKKQLVLGDEVETLAQRLAAAGYRTVGFTGNPYNSTATGMARGYEEFHEIWETDPGEITAEVKKLLAGSAGDDRPLFLMLHYVPPHEPYDPPPQFDLFGDPSYDGPVTPDRDLVRAIYSKEIEPDKADVKELEALYDGNLRRGDAAVGQVLAALRDAGTYDDTLVVVTSDHGEAFMEHGWIGHNTTLYDEMLRVPLILKPPASWPTEGVATDRMAGLADVVTTIDRRLGLGDPPEVHGQDLLASADDSQRVLFLRSAQEGFPYFGLRTRRFKAILREGNLPELYDVRADPHEEHDLFAEHPLLHAGLTTLLIRAVEDEGALRAGVREGEISEEHRKMLEALGYLGN